jgi:hypothetical protein
MFENLDVSQVALALGVIGGLLAWRIRVVGAIVLVLSILTMALYTLGVTQVGDFAGRTCHSSNYLHCGTAGHPNFYYWGEIIFWNVCYVAICGIVFTGAWATHRNQHRPQG